MPILNSNVVYYFLKEAYSGLAMGGGVNFTANNLSKIPIPNLTDSDIATLNNYTIFIQTHLNKDEFEQNLIDKFDEIDNYIYSLYSLDYEDIEVLTNFKSKNKRKR